MTKKLEVSQKMTISKQSKVTSSIDRGIVAVPLNSSASVTTDIRSSYTGRVSIPCFITAAISKFILLCWNHDWPEKASVICRNVFLNQHW